ncbi:MAG: hypothetical protein ACI4E1_04855 [Lachnospira sp.]
MIIYIIIFILIITMPQIAFSGTLNGLNLWVLKVLPGLFPAFIVSYCIIRLIPKNNKYGIFYIILTGLFCGFPAGAISCSAYCQKLMDTDNKHSLSSLKYDFLNNILYCINISSPAFILNYIYYYCLSGQCPLFLFLINIYLPVLVMLFLHFYNYKRQIDAVIKAADNKYTYSETVTDTSPELTENKNRVILPLFDEGLDKAVSQSLKLGGYIVFYSCVAAFVRKLCINSNLLFEVINGISVGIIEITNGLSAICQLNISYELKYIMIIIINSLGGLSTLAQTAYIISGTNLSIKKYIYHKIILTGFTSLLSLFMVYVLHVI